MEMKKKRAVLLSWMLIFTMVLGLFQGLSFVSEAVVARVQTRLNMWSACAMGYREFRQLPSQV